MTLEEIVLSIEQAQHLQELGLDMTDAALCWAVGQLTLADVTVRHESVIAMSSKPEQYAFIEEIIPTYTLEEILAHIPKVKYGFADITQPICYGNVDLDVDYCTGHRIDYFNLQGHGATNLQGAYKLLVWVLKNLKSGFFVKAE